jgi:transcriptional regulator with XRE-family HTH domain
MNRIKSERVGIGANREQFANLLQVHPNTIQNWENEDTDVPASYLIRMRDIFGCSIDFLLGVSEYRNPM